MKIFKAALRSCFYILFICNDFTVITVGPSFFGKKIDDYPTQVGHR